MRAQLQGIAHAKVKAHVGEARRNCAEQQEREWREDAQHNRIPGVTNLHMGPSHPDIVAIILFPHVQFRASLDR